MANTVINLRRGDSPFWSSTNLPAGVTGYTHGLVNANNFQGSDIFENSLTGKAEPWVNTTTKQLFVDGTCINPGLKLKINGGNASDVALKYDGNYNVYYDLNINYSDQYLKKVSNITIPSSENDAEDITAWLTNLGLTVANAPTLSDGVWSVTIGEDTYYFNSGKNYIGFTWNTADDVTTPTFLEVPDTDTTYGADRGISLVNEKFGHTNNVTGGASTTTTTLSGYTLTLPKINYDAHGHITSVGVDNVNLPQPGEATAAHEFKLGFNGTGDERSFELQQKTVGADDSTYSRIFKMVQADCDENADTPHDGSLISFKEKTNPVGEKTVLVNVDIIDGGSFN